MAGRNGGTPVPDRTFGEESRSEESRSGSHPVLLTDDDVRRVAALVRIQLDESEVRPLGAELSRIFGWIETLREVDVAGVAPMTSVMEMQLRERDDAVTDGNCRDRVLGNAPAVDDGYFVVPRVLE